RYSQPYHKHDMLTTPPLFFLSDPAATEIYTLSLHDALPISSPAGGPRREGAATPEERRPPNRVVASPYGRRSIRNMTFGRMISSAPRRQTGAPVAAAARVS